MQTRQATRSRTDRVVAGVAGGLAHYLGIDPIIARLVFLFLGFVHGIGVVAYLVLWVLMPDEDTIATDARTQVRENVSEIREIAEQLVSQVGQMFRK